MPRLPDPAVRRRREKLVQSFEKCDLTVSEFCERHGVSTASFYVWRRKICHPVESSGVFLPVTVASPRDCFRIRFGDQAVVEIPACETSTLLSVVEQLTTAVAGERGPQS